MSPETNIYTPLDNKSPIINGSEVTFVFTGKAETVYVAKELNNKTK